MKKIALFLIAILLLSCFGCSSNSDFNESGIDLNNDGNDDIMIKVPTPTIYTVSFQTNGGSYVDSKKLVNLEYAPPTSRDGYEFKGWYRDSGCTVPVIYPLKVDSNITLYAKWLRVEGVVSCR